MLVAGIADDLALVTEQGEGGGDPSQRHQVIGMGRFARFGGAQDVGQHDGRDDFGASSARLVEELARALVSTVTPDRAARTPISFLV